jgi:integrase
LYAGFTITVSERGHQRRPARSSFDTFASLAPVRARRFACFHLAHGLQQLGTDVAFRVARGQLLLRRYVDLESPRIRIRRQFTHGQFIEFPKTDSGVREVPMDAELVRVLADWKLSLPPDRKQLDSLVVATRGGPRVSDQDGECHAGGPISASNFLSREFYPALKAAKLPRVVFHSLRHTYKTVLVSTDRPPAVVHKILGHANFSTTLKLYGGVLPQALERAGGKTGAAFEPQSDKSRTNR